MASDAERRAMFAKMRMRSPRSPEQLRIEQAKIRERIEYRKSPYDLANTIAISNANFLKLKGKEREEYLLSEAQSRRQEDARRFRERTARIRKKAQKAQRRGDFFNPTKCKQCGIVFPNKASFQTHKLFVKDELHSGKANRFREGATVATDGKGHYILNPPEHIQRKIKMAQIEKEMSSEPKLRENFI